MSCSDQIDTVNSWVHYKLTPEFDAIALFTQTVVESTNQEQSQDIKWLKIGVKDDINLSTVRCTNIKNFIGENFFVVDAKEEEGGMFGGNLVPAFSMKVETT